MTDQARQVLTVCASHSPGMARDERREQGQTFRRGLDRAAEAIETFQPELVLIFGTDHRRAFATTVPAFAVVVSGTGRGDLGSPTGRYAVPHDDALSLAAELLRSGFDAAVSRDIDLDHGFGQTLGDLLGSIDRYPLIPIFVNCATPPLPPMSRVHDLGRRIGQVLPKDYRKVLVVGTGGLSHAPPSMAAELIGASEEERAAANRDGRDAARAAISPAWDRRFLEALAQDDAGWLRSLSDKDIDAAGNGAHECRTWVAAQAVAGRPLATVAYEPVPEWITGMGLVMSTPAAGGG
jgi:2,3-dihydroxyphenylpropionate 1,2-dioxygenase